MFDQCKHIPDSVPVVTVYLKKRAGKGLIRYYHVALQANKGNLIENLKKTEGKVFTKDKEFPKKVIVDHLKM